MKNPLLKFFLLLSILVPLGAFAQTSFDGMGRTADWTDLETTSDEMPPQIWGSCADTSEDRIGIRVDFQDGTSASAIYSGVSGVWNTTNFADILPDSSTGFFGACGGIHFLGDDNGSTLPLAWNGCTMAYSNNFDLDYTEYFGSQFRASTAGWNSVRIQTYCGAGVTQTQNIPAVPPVGLITLCLLLPLAGLMVLRKRIFPSK